MKIATNALGAKPLGEVFPSLSAPQHMWEDLYLAMENAAEEEMAPREHLVVPAQAIVDHAHREQIKKHDSGPRPDKASIRVFYSGKDVEFTTPDYHVISIYSSGVIRVSIGGNKNDDVYKRLKNVFMAVNVVVE